MTSTLCPAHRQGIPYLEIKKHRETCAFINNTVSGSKKLLFLTYNELGFGAFRNTWESLFCCINNDKMGNGVSVTLSLLPQVPPFSLCIISHVLLLAALYPGFLVACLLLRHRDHVTLVWEAGPAGMTLSSRYTLCFLMGFDSILQGSQWLSEDPGLYQLFQLKASSEV